MGESYSGGGAAGAAPVTAAGEALARDLIWRLVPGADAALVVRALLAERDAAAPEGGRDDPAAEELARVRRQLALGEAVLASRHEVNNPLAGLLAEAQLLELEPLAPEHGEAARRIVELARRVVAATRKLDAVGRPPGR